LILVLPADATGSLVDQVEASARRLGWSPQVSRGREQVVVALEGTGDDRALGEALAGLEVDVIPVHTAQEYRLMRARRTLLTAMATGLGLVTAVGAGIPVVGFLMPPSGALTDPDVVSVGTLARFPAGAARPVLFRGAPVLVIGLEPGRYVALSALCTRMKVCKLDWDGQRLQLACPCHGCVFDIHGNVKRGPASVPLVTYAVETVGDELFIRRS